MGYNVSVYTFYGAQIPESNLIEYFKKVYADEIKKQDYVGNEEEYLTEVLGLDWIFKKTFGFKLMFFSKGNTQYKYYVVIGDAQLIYKYNTNSDEYQQLPYECDLSLLSLPKSPETTQVDEIMKKLKVSEYKISARIVCDESF